jgi:hypothetical protein
MARHIARCRCLALAGALAVLPGCYAYHVTPQYADAVQRDPDGATMHSLFWGLAQSATRTPDCKGNGVTSVAARTNLGYALLSVVTLGIWVPLELEWSCAADN